MTVTVAGANTSKTTLPQWQLPEWCNNFFAASLDDMTAATSMDWELASCATMEIVLLAGFVIHAWVTLMEERLLIKL